MVPDLEIESFMRNFKRHFDNRASAPLTHETLFRDLPEWTSLQSLVVIVGFDEDYGVTISSEELQNAQTIADLWTLVRSKQGA